MQAAAALLADDAAVEDLLDTAGRMAAERGLAGKGLQKRSMAALDGCACGLWPQRLSMKDRISMLRVWVDENSLLADFFPNTK